MRAPRPLKLSKLTVDFEVREFQGAPGLALQHAAVMPDPSFGAQVGEPDGVQDLTELAALLRVPTLQPALSALKLVNANPSDEAELDAFVDAALRRKLRVLEVENGSPPAAAPLARLLAADVLTHLSWSNDDDGGQVFVAAADAVLLADALRGNTTLQVLELSEADLCADADAANALLHALVGHPVLRRLVLTSDDSNSNPALVGAALAAFVAADSPALEELDIRYLHLKEADLLPIVNALPMNRHLRVLRVEQDEDISDEFAQERLLRAWHANPAASRLSITWRFFAPAAALESSDSAE